MGGNSELPEWGLSAATRTLPYRVKQAEVRRMHREGQENQQRQTEDADLQTRARQAQAKGCHGHQALATPGTVLPGGRQGGSAALTLAVVENTLLLLKSVSLGSPVTWAARNQ